MYIIFYLMNVHGSSFFNNIEYSNLVPDAKLDVDAIMAFADEQDETKPWNGE